MDLALNNLQRLICHKTKPTNQPTNLSMGQKKVFDYFLYLKPLSCVQINDP